MKAKVRHSQRATKSGPLIRTRGNVPTLRSAKVRRLFKVRPVKPSRAKTSENKTNPTGTSLEEQALSQRRRPEATAAGPAQKRRRRFCKKPGARAGFHNADQKQSSKEAEASSLATAGQGHVLAVGESDHQTEDPKVSKALKQLKIDLVESQYTTYVDPSLTGRSRRSLTQPGTTTDSRQASFTQHKWVSKMKRSVKEDALLPEELPLSNILSEKDNMLDLKLMPAETGVKKQTDPVDATKREVTITESTEASTTKNPCAPKIDVPVIKTDQPVEPFKRRKVSIATVESKLDAKMEQKSYGSLLRGIARPSSAPLRSSSLESPREHRSDKPFGTLMKSSSLGDLQLGSRSCSFLDHFLKPNDQEDIHSFQMETDQEPSNAVMVDGNNHISSSALDVLDSLPSSLCTTGFYGSGKQTLPASMSEIGSRRKIKRTRMLLRLRDSSTKLMPEILPGSTRVSRRSGPTRNKDNGSASNSRHSSPGMVPRRTRKRTAKVVTVQGNMDVIKSSIPCQIETEASEAAALENNVIQVYQGEQSCLEQHSCSELIPVSKQEVLDENLVTGSTSKVPKVRKRRRRRRRNRIFFTMIKRRRSVMLASQLSRKMNENINSVSAGINIHKSETDLNISTAFDYSENISLEAPGLVPESAFLLSDENSFSVKEGENVTALGQTLTLLSSSSSQLLDKDSDTFSLMRVTKDADDTSVKETSQNGVFSSALSSSQHLTSETNLPQKKRGPGRPRKQHLSESNVLSVPSQNIVRGREKRLSKKTDFFMAKISSERPGKRKKFMEQHTHIQPSDTVVNSVGTDANTVVKRRPGRPRKRFKVSENSQSEHMLVENAFSGSIIASNNLTLSQQIVQPTSVMKVSARGEETFLPQQHSDFFSSQGDIKHILNFSGESVQTLGPEHSDDPQPSDFSQSSGQGALVNKIRKVNRRKLRKSRWSRGIMRKHPLKTVGKESRVAKTSVLSEDNQMPSSEVTSMLPESGDNIYFEQDRVESAQSSKVSEVLGSISKTKTQVFPRNRLRAKSIPRELKRLQEDDGTKKVFGRHFRRKIKSLSRKGLLLRSKAKSEDDVSSSHSLDTDYVDSKDGRKKKQKLSSKLYSIDTISETKMVFKTGLKSRSSAVDEAKSSCPHLSSSHQEAPVSPFILGTATITPATENNMLSHQNSDNVSDSIQESLDIPSESINSFVDVTYASREYFLDGSTRICFPADQLSTMHIDVTEDQPPPNITETNFAAVIHSEDLSPPPLIRPEDLFSGEYYATASSSKGSSPTKSLATEDASSFCNDSSCLQQNDDGFSQSQDIIPSAMDLLPEASGMVKRRGRPPKHLKEKGTVAGRKMGPASKTGRAPNIRAGPASSKHGRKSSSIHFVRYNLSSAQTYLTPTEPRKFALRPKTTRSPIEIIAMRQKQEEDEYDLEEATRLARRLKRQKAHDAKHALSVSVNPSSCQASELAIRKCSVVLVDFVKKLQLDTLEYAEQSILDVSYGSPDSKGEDDVQDNAQKANISSSKTFKSCSLETEEGSRNKSTKAESSHQHASVIKKQLLDLESLKSKSFIGNFVDFLENTEKEVETAVLKSSHVKKSSWHKEENLLLPSLTVCHSPAHTVALEPLESDPLRLLTESDILRAGEAVLNGAYKTEQSDTQVSHLERDMSSRRPSPQLVIDVSPSKFEEMPSVVSPNKAVPQRRLKIFPASDRIVLAKYICNQCDFTSSNKQTIESHVYRHIPGVAFYCGYCTSEFSAMASVLAHVKSSHTGKEAKVLISKDISETSMYRVEETVATESPGIVQQKSCLPNAAAIASQICETPSIQETQPLIISLVVSGEMAVQRQDRYSGQSMSSIRGRFVCTHCGYSTNVKEDIEQHIEDLHGDIQLYACYLCDKAFGESYSDICMHCSIVHPNRPNSFKKLPNFYDQGLISNCHSPSDKTKTEDRGNIFDRMSSLFQATTSEKGEDGHTSLHTRCQRAREYQQVVEGWRGKTSAEADSTTIGDVEPIPENMGSVEEPSLQRESDKSLEFIAADDLPFRDKCMETKTSETEPCSSTNVKDCDNTGMGSVEKSFNAQSIENSAQVNQEHSNITFLKDSITDDQKREEVKENYMDSKDNSICEDVNMKDLQEPKVGSDLSNSIHLLESEHSQSTVFPCSSLPDQIDFSMPLVSVKDKGDCLLVGSESDTGTELMECDATLCTSALEAVTGVMQDSANMHFSPTSPSESTTIVDTDKLEITRVKENSLFPKGDMSDASSMKKGSVDESAVPNSHIDSSAPDITGKEADIAHILDNLVNKVVALVSDINIVDTLLVKETKSAESLEGHISPSGVRDTFVDTLNISNVNMCLVSKEQTTAVTSEAEDASQGHCVKEVLPSEGLSAGGDAAVVPLQATADAGLPERRGELLVAQSRNDAVRFKVGEDTDAGDLEDDGDILVIELDGEVGDNDRSSITPQNEEAHAVDDAGRQAGDLSKGESKSDVSSCSIDDNGIGIKIVEVVSLHDNPNFHGISASPVKSSKTVQQSSIQSVEGSPCDKSPAPPLMSPNHSTPSVSPARKTSTPASSLPEVDADEIALRNERMVCTYKCHKCNVHSPALPPIVEHLKQYHSDVPLFSCPYCKGFRGNFYTEDDVHMHVKEKHPANYAKNEVSLSELAKSFVQVLAIPSGRNSGGGHIEQDVYMCLKCKGHLPDLDYAFKHLQEEHKELIKYTCPFCKTFRDLSQDVVLRHMQLDHQHTASDAQVPLAVEDNLFIKVSSISTGGVYIDHKAMEVSPATEDSPSGRSAGSSTPAEPVPKNTPLSVSPSKVPVLGKASSAEPSISQQSVALVSSAPLVPGMGTSCMTTVPIGIDPTALVPVPGSQFAPLGILQVSPYLFVPAPAHLAGMPVSVEGIVSPAHHGAMAITAQAVSLQHSSPMTIGSTHRPILPAPAVRPSEQSESALGGDLVGSNVLYPSRLTVKKILDQKKKNQEWSQVSQAGDASTPARGLPLNQLLSSKVGTHSPSATQGLTSPRPFGGGVARQGAVWSPASDSPAPRTQFPAGDVTDSSGHSRGHPSISPSSQASSVTLSPTHSANVATLSNRPVLRVPDVLNLSLTSRSSSATLSQDAAGVAEAAGERFSPNNLGIAVSRVSPLQGQRSATATPVTCGDMEVENPDAYKIFNLKPRALSSPAPAPRMTTMLSTASNIPVLPRSPSVGLDSQRLLHPNVLGANAVPMASSALFPQQFRLQQLPSTTISGSQPGLTLRQGPLLITAAQGTMLVPALVQPAHDHTQIQAASSLGKAPAAHQQKPSTLSTAQAATMQQLIFSQPLSLGQNTSPIIPHSSSSTSATASPQRPYMSRAGTGVGRGRPRLNRPLAPTAEPLLLRQRSPVLPAPQQQQQRYGSPGTAPSPPRAHQRQATTQQCLCPYCPHQIVLKPWEVSQHIHVHHPGKDVVYKRLDKGTAK